ncbi:hypothetical protein UlMin_002757 [Ulmus minor]
MEKSEDSETESQLGHDWSELSHECLVNVLSRLTLEHRWRGPMFVCKSWLEACKDPTLHSVIDLETHFVPESARWWTPEFERKIDSMLRSVVEWSDGSIKEIRIRHCSNRSLAFAAERCQNLEVLSIKSCPNVTDESMAMIAFRFPMLRELDISYCYEISHESLEFIGRKCPNLKILKRNLMNWLDPSHVGIVPDAYVVACGDWEASAIGKTMPHLEHLELRFSKLSAKGIASISEGCLNLEYVDLFGCENLTSRDIANAASNLKNLKEIKRPNFCIPRPVFRTERYWPLEIL